MLDLVMKHAVELAIGVGVAALAALVPLLIKLAKKGAKKTPNPYDDQIVEGVEEAWKKRG